MKWPNKKDLVYKLLQNMPRDGRMSLAEISSLMESVGYTPRVINQSLGKIEERGLINSIGEEFELSTPMRRFFNDIEAVPYVGEVAAPRVPPKFEPLSKKYIDDMQRAMRLEDGHEPMRFVPSASRPNVYRELGND